MIRVATSDGEAAEQTGLRLTKESGVLPNLDLILRCSLHGLQRALENTVMSDPYVKAVLTEFVLKYAGSKTGEHGSFIRAVRNSQRLKNLVGDAMAATLQELAEEAEALAALVPALAKALPGEAPQRFDSLLRGLQRFVWHCRACIRFLCVVKEDGGDSSAWAAGLLHFLTHRDDKKTPQNLLLLALVAELMQTSSKYIHRSETSKEAEHHIARTASRVHRWEQELHHLFSVTDEEGGAR